MRVEEGRARVGVLERGERACDRLQVDADARAALAQATPGDAQPLEQPFMDGRREQQRGPGQRRGSQHGAHLVSQAATGDQHQALDALGELVEELHRHAAAERVPDDRRAVHTDGREQVADARRMRAQGVVAAWRRRVAVPDEVGRDHHVVLGEVQRHRLPVAGGVEHPVDQHDRGP